MVLKAFKQARQVVDVFTSQGEKNNSEKTARVQDNIKQVFNQLNSCPLVTGNRLTGDNNEGVQITSSTTKVEHKLGRQPLGYMILKLRGNSVVWMVSMDDLFITFDCTVDVKIDLWVF